MRIIELLNELAFSIGIGSVTPDETGSVTLLFDNEHEVTFMPDDGADVFFQCEIGDASMLDADGCRALLEASFSQTDGAAFAIHPALQKVVLWKRYGEFASRAEFEKVINDFLGLVVSWKQRLASGDFSAEGASESTEPQPTQIPGLATNFIQV
ncbi:MAG: type III secretion system chaperone [Victivallales bacterium]|nr:type III secretion system chaperone [Victivallales bacterium]